MDRIDKAGSVLNSIGSALGQLEKNCKTLADILKKHGTELQQAFADMALSKDLDEDARAVAEIFVAWREIGEAQIALSTKLVSVSAQVAGEMKQMKAEQSQRLSEASNLQTAVKVAATKVEQPEKSRGWGAALFGTAEQPQRDEAVERKRLNSFQSATNTLLDQLAEQLGSTQSRSRGGLNNNIGEVRRHAKAFGEKLLVLRPSWKGVSGVSGRIASNSQADGSSTANGSASSPLKSSPSKGSKVEGLIKSMATAEGRRRAQEEEAVEEAKTAKTVVEEAPLLAPPVEQLGAQEWRIKGVYEHQLLKAGLRQLDNEWPTKGLHEFPRNKDGSSILFRQRLFGELLAGRIPLQSVPNNDISAAQPDIKHLSLRQLLRLRVQHIDFNPSGCGADTVMAVGDRHEAFLRTLDSKLFQSLGERATKLLSESDDTVIDTSAMHRYGREVVMLTAAAAAVKDPPWWSWWITNDRRVFFHAERFEAIGKFPEDGVGVLQITHDTSRPDKHDPSGKLRWFDWRVSCAVAEADLCEGPPTAATTAAVGNESTESSTTENAPAKATSSGAATAEMVSPELLKDLRSSLRKTERR